MHFAFMPHDITVDWGKYLASCCKAVFPGPSSLDGVTQRAVHSVLTHLVLHWHPLVWKVCYHCTVLWKYGSGSTLLCICAYCHLSAHFSSLQTYIHINNTQYVVCRFFQLQLPKRQQVDWMRNWINNLLCVHIVPDFLVLAAICNLQFKDVQRN